MNPMVAVAVYTPFAVITAVVLMLELFRGFKRNEDYIFLVLCLCIALWFATDIATLLVDDVRIIRLLFNVKLIFVGYVPPVLLLFVLRFFRVTLGKRRNVVMWLLFTVPTINIPIALTSRLHSWMVDIQITALLPYREISIIWGPWFWVHTAQSYLVSVAIITVVIIRHFRLPHFYRLPSTLMGLGIFLTLSGNIITLLQVLPPSIDPTLITCSLSLILFDLAIINNNKSKFVRFSHKRIYHYLEEYILILDETQRVLEWNQPAERWFQSQGVALKDNTLPRILDDLLGKEAILEKESQDHKGTNIRLIHGDFPVVLNLKTHQITDAHNDVIGVVAVFQDITQTQALIQKLEEKAGMDSLTGIPNHLSYTGAKARMNHPEHLPLSVIVCDANGLKAVNDTMGHQYGNLLLKIIAEVLENELSHPHFVARTGGDEFVCLLPQTPLEDALQTTERVQRLLDSLDQYPFALSLAMGVATKYHSQEDLESLIAVADRNMYLDKKRQKENSPAGTASF